MQTITDKPIARIMAAIRRRERWDDIEELLAEALDDLETVVGLAETTEEDDTATLEAMRKAAKTIRVRARWARGSLTRIEELVMDDRARAIAGGE
jgi:hypothetical protein